MTDQKDNWTKFYTGNSTMAFPPEGLIRVILGGPYPGQKMPKPQPRQVIVDVGCGDGSSFPLYRRAGLHAWGIEVSEEIAASTRSRIGTPGDGYGDIFIGTCSSIPLSGNFCDYLVAWNSCYYMSLGTGKFEDHVSEMARILKPDGWIIVSVPRPDCFIFDDIETVDGTADYVRIRSEYFGLRSGEIMRFFGNRPALELAFSSHFTDFSHSSIDIDWFGLRYSWFVFTARKNNSSEPYPISLPL